MSGENLLLVAAAGSGKTTYLIDQAAQHEKDRILITTYTEANEAQIRNGFIEKCGFVPAHVTVQTWFSFVIQHGVKPFQSHVLDRATTGLYLTNRASTRGIPEREADRYYLTAERRIYSDKLSKLAVVCNERSGGKVVERISRIFSHVYVDEVQDLAGYDLDVLRALFATGSRVILVGDPRQVTYLTHRERRYDRYSEGKIREFVESECKTLRVTIDDTTLSASFRSNRNICEFSDRLYPQMKATASMQVGVTGHDGVFLVDEKHRDAYLARFTNAVQLRYSRSRRISPDRTAFNFGEAKGLSFDRVLIHPTEGMREWLGNASADLPGETRAKFYVALTRARYSVAILCDEPVTPPVGVSRWHP